MRDALRDGIVMYGRNPALIMDWEAKRNLCTNVLERRSKLQTVMNR
jgi:hypothetical protein